MAGEVRRQHLIQDGQASAVEGLVYQATKNALVVAWRP
jgi:hypothetical protein